MTRFLLILLCLSAPAQAKDFEIEIHNRKDEQILTVNGNDLHTGSLTHGFVKYEKLKGFPRTYLASVWRKGAHGESVYVHDLESGKQVWVLHSSWPIDLVTADGLLTVSYTLDSDKEGRFPRHRVDWRGTGK